MLVAISTSSHVYVVVDFHINQILMKSLLQLMVTRVEHMNFLWQFHVRWVISSPAPLSHQNRAAHR